MMNKNTKKISENISTLFEDNISESLLPNANIPFTFLTGKLSDRLDENGEEVNWNLTDIKIKIASFAEDGKLSDALIRTIYKNGTCAPVEFEFLDYKQDIENTKLAKAKLVLRIVSFYNSYGGYIVFGVAETIPETKFDVIGFDHSKLEFESIKALIKDYTGVRIQIGSINFEVMRADGKLANISFLYVPKRPDCEPPLHFIKDSPIDEKNKSLFQRDDVFCRRGDECIQARGPKVLELNRSRVNPYSDTEISPTNNLFRLNRLPHNLPDRNFICPKFVGRDGIIDSLWLWLADDLSHVRVLAGEGGLGKSSIAYEFAEKVSETPDVPFEHLVWLTAKEKQFKAYEDKYESVPEKHYSTYFELLNVICASLPYTSSELEGASETELKRMIKRGLIANPTFIIIDDLDSLTVEEQKQALEIGSLIAGSNSRALLTTRNNQVSSNDTVLKISGFSLGEEFNEYIYALKERLKFQDLNNAEVEKIHSVTHGSPLFTESLIRLLRWNSLGDAISMWKSERGSTVRAAALSREIELLSAEAKRILLAIALMGEASVVELREVLAYPSESIEAGLQELNSLFLIAAPSLASIPRFRVPSNTRRLVIDANTTLVTDKSRLERDITSFKQRNNQKPTKDSRVAAAISQAAALMRTGDVESAIATIKDAQSRVKDNPDLLSYEATLQLKKTPPSFDESRRLARSAYVKGCKKPELFECWFEAEWLAANYIGALEAADAALSEKCSGTHDWLIKKSAALASKASIQARSGSVEDAVSTMFEASATIKAAISIGTRDDSVEWRNQQYKLHDQIWVWPVSEDGLGRTTVQLNILESFKAYGDQRPTNKKRVLSALTTLATFIERKEYSLSVTQKNLYSSIVTRTSKLLDLTDNTSADQYLQQQWDLLQTRLAVSISKNERV